MGRPEYRFMSGDTTLTELAKQIAEAAKAWRIADVENLNATQLWHTESDVARKAKLWSEVALLKEVAEGTLAKLQLLTDKYIQATLNANQE